MGWEEAHSASAASSISFFSGIVLWCIPLTSNTPRVSVPVLSNTTMLVWDRASR